MRSVPFVSLVARSSPRKRLWLAGAGLALFLLTFVVGNGVIRRDRAVTRADLGHDFLAFYTGATFVRDGRYRDLYDLEAVRRAESATARAAGIDLGTAFGPWWNPPFYALALSPLARLPYATALDVWRWINVAALVAAAVVLGRMSASKEAPDGPTFSKFVVTRRGARDLNNRGGRFSGHRWRLKPPPRQNGCGSRPQRHSHRTWKRLVHPGLRSAALILLLLATSMPFVQAIGHAQNTCTSLLLLSITVALWRGGRAVWAGVACGLLFYKPQLAAVVAGVMVIDLGWAALGGLAIAGVALLLLTAIALPGSLGDWLRKLPANVRFMQVEHPYLWDRHVTIKSFCRLLLQGTAAGEATTVTTALTVAGWIAIAGPLVWVAVRARRSPGCTSGASTRRDRLITATICAMPLLMPFYFDYDLLLLAVPATLYAADRSRDRAMTVGWVALYAWMFVNAPVASRFHVCGAVVALAVVTVTAIRRVDRRAPVAGPIHVPVPARMATAA